MEQIRGMLEEQDINMQELKHKDPELYELLRKKYGTIINPAELSAGELLRLEENGQVELPNKSLKTLAAAKEIEDRVQRRREAPKDYRRNSLAALQT